MVVLERHEQDRRQEKIERKGRKRRASDSEASLGARYPHQGHGPLKITGSGASKRKRREPEEQDKDEDVEQGETEDDSEDGDAAGGRKKSTRQSSTCPHCKKVLVNGVTKRYLDTASCEKARQLARSSPWSPFPSSPSSPAASPSSSSSSSSSSASPSSSLSPLPWSWSGSLHHQAHPSARRVGWRFQRTACPDAGRVFRALAQLRIQERQPKHPARRSLPKIPRGGRQRNHLDL